MNRKVVNTDMISIIIPTYNRKRFIGDAIDSVLMQKYDKKEIIIVDDLSTDGTEEYIKEKYSNNPNVYYYKNSKNSGAGLSRKYGYEKSSGEYVIFMDDDDYYTNYNFFTQAIDIMKQRKNLSFLSSNSLIEYCDDGNRRELNKMNIDGEINNSEYLSSFQQKYMKSSSTFTTVFRKSKLEEANFEKLEMVNDSSIYLRALLSGNAFVMQEVSGAYRVHSSNITFNLNVDFVIDNLIEKRKVYNEIIERKLLENPDEWLKMQVSLTLKYFIENNKLDSEKIDKIINWCQRNMGASSSEIIEQIELWRKKV